MEIIDKKMNCSICGKEIIVTVTSIGVTHQMIEGFVCEDCYRERLKELREKVEDEKFERIKEFMKSDKETLKREVETKEPTPEVQGQC
ncbi:hypothetical protein AKJ40_00835 [candidate division MSBL1 archaeon SCGC-AAA259M10]|uniref:TRASH domain-containing protein n=1 Tax=candidate division MSBL1 archaeon SCGC-AAA259M10 TaxID=1698270 RepID=A0A133V2R1_9EURY|nr:hypothetical protein AKJ40_00835 [candidate division MSBL1 archaeon SCGC-AAA259M10]